MKTLGQIAYEAAKVNQVSWDRVCDSRKSDWEAAAQAVREAVIEECANVCAYGLYTWASENSDKYLIQAEWSRILKNNIRALKDKK